MTDTSLVSDGQSSGSDEDELDLYDFDETDENFTEIQLKDISERKKVKKHIINKTLKKMFREKKHAKDKEKEKDGASGGSKIHINEGDKPQLSKSSPANTSKSNVLEGVKKNGSAFGNFKFGSKTNLKDSASSLPDKTPRSSPPTTQPTEANGSSSNLKLSSTPPQPIPKEGSKATISKEGSKSQMAARQRSRSFSGRFSS